MSSIKFNLLSMKTPKSLRNCIYIATHCLPLYRKLIDNIILNSSYRSKNIRFQLPPYWTTSQISHRDLQHLFQYPSSWMRFAVTWRGKRSEIFSRTLALNLGGKLSMILELTARIKELHKIVLASGIMYY